MKRFGEVSQFWSFYIRTDSAWSKAVPLSSWLCVDALSSQWWTRTRVTEEVLISWELQKVCNFAEIFFHWEEKLVVCDYWSPSLREERISSSVVLPWELSLGCIWWVGMGWEAGCAAWGWEHYTGPRVILCRWLSEHCEWVVALVHAVPPFPHHYWIFLYVKYIGEKHYARAEH